MSKRFRLSLIVNLPEGKAERRQEMKRLNKLSEAVEDICAHNEIPARIVVRIVSERKEASTLIRDSRQITIDDLVEARP